MAWVNAVLKGRAFPVLRQTRPSSCGPSCVGMVLQWKHSFGQLDENYFCQICGAGAKGGASTGYIRQINTRVGFKPLPGIAASAFGANPDNMGGTYIEGLKKALETQCREDRRVINCVVRHNPNTATLKTALKNTRNDGTRPVILFLGFGHFIAVHSNKRPGFGKTRIYLVGDPAVGGITMTVERTEQTPPIVHSPNWANPGTARVQAMLTIA